MRRFVQADQRKDVHGLALQSVSCQGIKDQLPDGELVIGDNTRKYLALLNPDKQKAALLGMRAFGEGGGGSRISLASQITSVLTTENGSLQPSPSRIFQRNS